MEARAWLVDPACRKAKELGYPHEVWTARLLAAHAGENVAAAGHPCLSEIVQGTVCKILDAEDVKRHLVRYYLQRRDREFGAKMAEVLGVYRQVKLLMKRPAHTAIKVILDNHSALISRETRCWLDEQRPARFEFEFTPKHGSWLNLVEGFFSKLTRSVLRHIRVASTQRLKDRMIAAIGHFNRNPVVHTWTYKLDRAA